VLSHEGIVVDVVVAGLAGARSGVDPGRSVGVEPDDDSLGSSTPAGSATSSVP
jgi:hypothetical protein